MPTFRFEIETESGRLHRKEIDAPSQDEAWILVCSLFPATAEFRLMPDEKIDPEEAADALVESSLREVRNASVEPAESEAKPADAATTAGATDSSAMTDEQILERIRESGEREGRSLKNLVVLAVSLVLFFGAGIVAWSLLTVALIAAAILIHELGHLLAMRIFRYKNLSMLFIPLVGGVARGEPRDHDARKIALITIFGPLIGLASCVVTIIAWALGGPFFLLQYAVTGAFINGFNLLPVLPLDGGRYLNELLFERRTWIEITFRILALVGLILLAIYLRSIILGLLSFFMIVGLRQEHTVAVTVQRLRKDLDWSDSELDATRVGVIRRVLRDVNAGFESSTTFAKNAPEIVKQIWSRQQKSFPSMERTVALVLLYVLLTVIVAPALLGVSAYLFQGPIFEAGGG